MLNSTRAAVAAWSSVLVDHQDVDLATQPQSAGIERACRRPIRQ